MSSQTKLFISFSSKDQVKIRSLFAALEIQGVKVWDYSDEGQELPVGSELRASLKASIDSYEYFIAIVSPNSIDQNLSHDPYFEVRYAIDSGKLKNKQLLPVLLD